VAKNKYQIKRRAMPRISDQMKEWSARLGEEILRWPNVSARPMFGLLGYYRKESIFAALPVTRAIGTPHSIIFKFKSMNPEVLRRAKSDPRVDPERVGPGVKWSAFEVQSEQDLRDALWWLNQAYQQASKRSKGNDSKVS
jgi:hypothetical protein